MNLKLFLKPTKTKIIWWVVWIAIGIFSCIFSWILFYPYREAFMPIYSTICSTWDTVFGIILLIIVFLFVPYVLACLTFTFRKLIFKTPPLFFQQFSQKHPISTKTGQVIAFLGWMSVFLIIEIAFIEFGMANTDLFCEEKSFTQFNTTSQEDCYGDGRVKFCQSDGIKKKCECVQEAALPACPAGEVLECGDGPIDPKTGWRQDSFCECFSESNGESGVSASSNLFSKSCDELEKISAEESAKLDFGCQSDADCLHHQFYCGVCLNNKYDPKLYKDTFILGAEKCGFPTPLCPPSADCQCVNNKCEVMQALDQQPVATPPQDRLLCETDDDCVSAGVSDDCCDGCVSEAINKATAEKEENDRKIRCAIKKELCPNVDCMWWPGRELKPICRDQQCIFDADYIIKQAVKSGDINVCKKEKHEYDRDSCYSTMALSLKDRSVCEKISKSEGIMIGDREGCYHDLAILTKDMSLCESAGGGTCWIQMAVYYNQPELVRHIADWLDYQTTKESVEMVIGWFEECQEWSLEKRDECYLIEIEKAWAPYYTLEIMCDKVGDPESCYRKYLENYPPTLTLAEAIEIGKKELKNRGYLVEDMNVSADENNTLWQESITKDPSILQIQIVKNLNLGQKNYWAIYYTPKEIQPGGDAWIFVNTNDGEIIGVILGE